MLHNWILYITFWAGHENSLFMQVSLPCVEDLGENAS